MSLACSNSACMKPTVLGPKTCHILCDTDCRRTSVLRTLAQLGIKRNGHARPFGGSALTPPCLHFRPPGDTSVLTFSRFYPPFHLHAARPSDHRLLTRYPPTLPHFPPMHAHTYMPALRPPALRPSTRQCELDVTKTFSVLHRGDLRTNFTLSRIASVNHSHL